MIPCIDNPEVISSEEPLFKIDMGQIDPDDMKVMLEHSRDGFYSNKELAPIREYSTNARDAHFRKGIPNTPIKVTLPCQMEPVLKIRDFGNGLTLDEISNVYFKYWKSTKRNNNDENGCLGIGSKSAFAYSSIYTVTTWCEGMKTVTTGQKNGFANVIQREKNTENEPDGVEISIPILNKDIEKFRIEAFNFYKFWDVRPELINVNEEEIETHFKDMDVAPFLSGNGWEIRPIGYGYSSTVSVMCNVAYSVDWNQIRNGIDKKVGARISGIFDFLSSNHTTFRFPNGSISFTPNRESLQYNEPTLIAISQRLEEIYDTLFNMITSKISKATNLWEAKIIYNSIFRKELDGFDKDSFYGGNLHSLESLLSGKVEWNGIKIEDGLFRELHHWDTESGYQDSPRGNKPLFQIFVKESSGKVKPCRCNYRRNNKMIAAPKAMVIIQDTKKARYLSAAASFYLNLKNNTNITQVYTLKFINDDIKTKFFNHYNFNSVPVVYISQIEDTIKKYIDANKVKTVGGGTTNALIYNTPSTVKAIIITNRRNRNGIDSAHEYDEEVNLKDVKDALFIVKVKSRYNTTYKIRTGFATELSDYTNRDNYFQAVYDLIQLTGTKADTIYVINEKKYLSPSFDKLKSKNNWMLLGDFVKNEIGKLNQTDLQNAFGFSDSNYPIGIQYAEKLLPLLKYNGQSYKYFSTITELVESIKYISMINHLHHYNDFKEKVSDFSEKGTQFLNEYPMISKFDSLTRRDNLTIKYDVDEELILLADYINVIDSNNGKLPLTK